MSGSMENTSSSLQPSPTDSIDLSCRQQIVKEGWLYKRGEHIKNWRKRYFILRADGSLIGFKSYPETTSANQQVEPSNNFTVARCQIMSVDHQR